MRTWVNWLPLVVLAVMAAGFLALGVAEARADAPTFDEPVYVSAGLAAVLHHDVTLNDEHPPLPKVLAVLPVLFMHPVVPANGRWSGNDEERYGARFVAAQLAAGKLRSVTFASRLVPLAETAGVAFVLFAVASELSGPVAGALAGMLWLASPFVLGIGHLDGTDVPFALGASLSSWALVRWLRLARYENPDVAGIRSRGRCGNSGHWPAGRRVRPCRHRRSGVAVRRHAGAQAGRAGRLDRLGVRLGGLPRP